MANSQGERSRFTSADGSFDEQREQHSPTIHFFSLHAIKGTTR